MATIADPAAGFKADSERRALPRALADGIEALKADAEIGAGGSVSTNRWAWPAPGDMEVIESAGSKELRVWDAKIKSARLENAWADSLRAAAATPFGRQPTLVDYPSQIEDFAAGVDDQETEFGEYWSNLFWWKLVDGIRYTLVELPAEQAAGDAYFVQLEADQLLSVRTMLKGRQRRLTEARILLGGSRPVPLGEDPEDWPVGAVAVPRVRIYRTGDLMGTSGVVFREAEKGKRADQTEGWRWLDDWQPLMARNGPYTEIPLVPHYAQRVAPFRGWPPFADTASQQGALWRKTLDYDEKCRRDARSVLVITGATSSQHVHKLGVVWVEEPEAKPWLLETTGAALGALYQDLESIAQAIRVGNMRPMLAAPVMTQTATEIMVRELAAKTQLEMWIKWDIAAFEQAFRHKMALDGLGEAVGTVQMPHDFSLNPETVKMLWEGYLKSGGKLVPPEVIWPELATHNLIQDSHDVDKIVARVRESISAGQTSPPPPGDSGAQQEQVQ